MTDLLPCAECGQPHVRPTHPGVPTCIRHKAKHNGGGPCLQWRWTGQKVCKRHGAMSGQAKAKALERIASAEADQVVRKMFDSDAPPIKDATASMLKLAGQLEVLVAKLSDELDTGVVTEGDDGRLRARAVFWDRMLGHLRQLLVDIARLRLGDRLAELEEEKVKIAAVGMGRVIVAFVPVEFRVEAYQMLRAELRAELPEIGEGS